MSYTRTYEMLEDCQKDLLNQIQNQTARRIWIFAMEDVYTPIHEELVRVLNKECSNLPKMSAQEIEEYVYLLYSSPEDNSFLVKYPGLEPIHKIFTAPEWDWLFLGEYCDECDDIFYEPNPHGIGRSLCQKHRN